MIKTKLNCFFIFFLSCNYLLCQINNPDLDLSSKVVKDILQQKNGLLWVGTDEGLNVFYDNEKKVFYSDILDSLSVLNSSVDNIMMSSRNDLIVISKDGLSIFDSNSFNFKQIKLDSKPTSVNEDLNSGKLWVSTENSGYYLINNDEVEEHFVFDPLNPLSISSSNFTSNDKNKIILSDSLNSYIATKNGLNIYNKKLKTFKRIFKGSDSKLSTNVIVGVQFYKNKIFIASENEVVLYRNESKKFERIFSPKEKITSFISIIDSSSPILSTANKDFKFIFENGNSKFELLDDKIVLPNQKITATEKNILFWERGSSSIVQTNLEFLNKLSLSIPFNINSIRIGKENEVFIGTNDGVKY